MSHNSHADKYRHIAKRYADTVDEQPIHQYYARPGILSLLPAQLENLNALDIGCGTGWYSEKLLQAGCQVTAIDANETMVAVTRERLKGKASCQQAKLEQGLRFLADHRFDILLAPLVIHYIKDWPPLFKELSRILKPGGYFIFSTHEPHTQYQKFKLDNYFEHHMIEDYWQHIQSTVQFYHHSLHDLCENLHSNGLLIDKMIEPPPQPAMQAKDKQLYHMICQQPWFLFVRAVKPK